MSKKNYLPFTTTAESIGSFVYKRAFGWDPVKIVCSQTSKD